MKTTGRAVSRGDSSPSSEQRFHRGRAPQARLLLAAAATFFICAFTADHAVALTGADVAIYDDAGAKLLDGTAYSGAWAPGVTAIKNMLTNLGYTYEVISYADLNTSPQNFSKLYKIILVPGGFASYYNYWISLAGKQRIRDFVAAGGGYYGICAGAFFATDRTNWEGIEYDDTYLVNAVINRNAWGEITGYDLNLFPGVGTGPMNAIADFWTTHYNMTTLRFNSTSSILQNYKQAPFSEDVLYYGGPWFQADSGASVAVLATYDYNSKPAIVAFSYGKGRVILSGPHPEIEEDSDRDGVTIERESTMNDNGSDWPLTGHLLLWLKSALQTRVIALAGNLVFGNVTTNATATSTMTISNSGNSTLTVSGITCPSGFSGNWTSGTIAAGASKSVTVTFSPTAATSYNGTLTVDSDFTSGTNTIGVSGQGAATSGGGATATLVFPAASGNASVTFPQEFRWTLNATVAARIYFAASATPGLIVGASKSVGGSGTFSLTAAEWNEITEALGASSTYYWTVGSANDGGQTLYAAWQAIADPKAKLLTPANGAVLVAASTAFTWDAGTGAQKYALWVGSTPGGYDIYGADEGAGRSRTVTLPTDGRPVYVRLWTMFNGAWEQCFSYSFTAQRAAGTNVKAQMLTSANSSTLASSNATLTWDAGTGAGGYNLWVGSTLGGYDLYAGDQGTNLSKTITLPTDGRQIYVRLWTKFSGTWQQYNTYSYTAKSQ